MSAASEPHSRVYRVRACVYFLLCFFSARKEFVLTFFFSDNMRLSFPNFQEDFPWSSTIDESGRFKHFVAFDYALPTPQPASVLKGAISLRWNYDMRSGSYSRWVRTDCVEVQVAFATPAPTPGLRFRQRSLSLSRSPNLHCAPQHPIVYLAPTPAEVLFLPPVATQPPTVMPSTPPTPAPVFTLAAEDGNSEDELAVMEGDFASPEGNSPTSMLPGIVGAMMRSPAGSEADSTFLIIGVVAGAVVLLLCVFAIVVLARRRRAASSSSADTPVERGGSSTTPAASAGVYSSPRDEGFSANTYSSPRDDVSTVSYSNSTSLVGRTNDSAEEFSSFRVQQGNAAIYQGFQAAEGSAPIVYSEL